jgi:protein-tyrosine kinase
MGRTYQALLRAEKEQNKSLLVPQRGPSEAHLPALPQDGDTRRIPEWFRELKLRLQTQTAQKPCQLIMFTGSHRECGCTSTAAGFGGTLANYYGHRVLLLDLNFRFPGLTRLYEDDFHELDDIFRSESGFLPQNDGKNGNLYVVSCNNTQTADVSKLLDSQKYTIFMEEMKLHFDFILVDTPPVITYSESRLIASKMDGVVLVLQSGKSRLGQAERAIREIESVGGKLLGVVLNRRKFHIPKWLYKRL